MGTFYLEALRLRAELKKVRNVPIYKRNLDNTRILTLEEYFEILSENGFTVTHNSLDVAVRALVENTSKMRRSSKPTVLRFGSVTFNFVHPIKGMTKRVCMFYQINKSKYLFDLPFLVLGLPKPVGKVIRGMNANVIVDL
jgi:hypothetical protein